MKDEGRRTIPRTQHAQRPRRVLAAAALLTLGCAAAQAQLLGRPGDAAEATRIFYDTRAVTAHTTELTGRGSMKFIISHRFGPLSSGAYQLFGLDQATIRIGLDYGVTDWLDVGVGRNGIGKTVDGFAKVNLLRQVDGGSPVAVTGLAGIGVNGLRFSDPERENLFSSRLSYVFQVHAARRVHDRLSLMLSPTLVHRNLVPTAEIDNDVYALGATARALVTKRVALTVQYYYVPDGQLARDRRDFLGVGVDVETKGHVFQLYAGNSRAMGQTLVFTETTGEWLAGDVSLGFNITRDFRLRAKRGRRG